jgi:hypothetical protein
VPGRPLNADPLFGGGVVAFARAIGALITMILLLAAIGAGIGYALGRFMPDYYRSVFRASGDPSFNPVSVGVGQGLTQGAVGGVVAGLAVVALLCWRDVRLRRPADGASKPVVGSGMASARVQVIAAATFALMVCCGAALLLGEMRGANGANHRRYLEEREALMPVLASDPSFSGIEISERSKQGGVDLVGEVSSTSEMERLRVVVSRAIGEARAAEALTGVGVRKQSIGDGRRPASE